MISARAWCRADFAGGTLDIWPIGLLHPGACTVNVALDVAVGVRINLESSLFRVRQGDVVVEGRTPADLIRQPESALVGVVASVLGLPPCEIVLTSASPRGAGLGASSAMVIALIAGAERALNLTESAPHVRARLARDVEARLMGLPTGMQDHYPALLGGALEISHLPGGERVRELHVNLELLGSHLLIVHSGRSHFSAGANWQVIRRRLEGDQEICALLGGIAEIAAQVPAALEGGDFERVGELVGHEWRLRRQLSAETSTPGIENLLSCADRLGAWGGKASGAGGGGCVLILCPAAKRAEIARELTAVGGTLLAAQPATGAVTVRTVETSVA